MNQYIGRVMTSVPPPFVLQLTLRTPADRAALLKKCTATTAQISKEVAKEVAKSKLSPAEIKTIQRLATLKQAEVDAYVQMLAKTEASTKAKHTEAKKAFAAALKVAQSQANNVSAKKTKTVTPKRKRSARSTKKGTVAQARTKRRTRK
jgi:predicted regulator of Ras-like GTPase activity (Roadblock/LC7/MglB family)